MKFKLIAGKHTVSNGNVNHKYGAGDIIESDEDLCAKFENKFERIVAGCDVVTSQPRSEHPRANVSSETAQRDEQSEQGKAAQNIVQLADGSPAMPDEDADDDTDVDEDAAPVVTLKAVHRGNRQWDVVKVVDGELTDECVNAEYLGRKEAQKIAREGIEE